MVGVRALEGSARGEVAWVEEKVFRGERRGALGGGGGSGGKANCIQALVFKAYHAVVVTMSTRAVPEPTDFPVAQAIVLSGFLFGFGLLFGLMRIRTRSIVMSFSFHATFDALKLMLTFGPLAAFMYSISNW